MVTVILFSVSVPVLSQHTTVALPSVSTAGRLFTSAFFFAIRCTPNAIIMVAVAGNPSGIMDMASEMPRNTSSSQPRSMRVSVKPIISMTAATIRPITVRILPTELSLRFMGVWKSSCCLSMPAILPTSVFMPVPTTTPTPLPYITTDDEYAMFTLSPRGASSLRTVGPSFGLGTLSPVSEASCTLMLLSLIILMSAGTIEPSSRYTMSPGTSCSAGTMLSSPSRRTRALGAVIFLSASSASAAFFSWMTPTVALSTMTQKIIMASARPSPSMNCITSEKIIATNRIMTMTSEICSSIIFHTDFGFTSAMTFLPYFSSLSAASLSESPSSLVPRSFSASS